MVDQEEQKVERPHRSVSQLLSYSGCSERYRLERIAKVPQRPAAWTFGGNAVHTGIEAWEKSGRTLGPEEVDDIVVTDYRNRANKLLETWDVEQFMTGGRKKAETDLDDREEKAALQAADYQDWAESQAHLWTVEASEVGFTLMVGDVPVQGYIDQVIRWANGALSVRDLKSGNHIPGSPVQLAVYAHAVNELYDTDVRHGEFAKLMNPAGRSAASQTVQLVEYDLTEEPCFDWDFLVQFFRDLDRGIEQQVFIPNPSDSCMRTCSVSQWCRAMGTKSSAQQQQEGLMVA